MIVFFRMCGTFKTVVRKISFHFPVSISLICFVKTFYFLNCIFIHSGMRFRHEDSVCVPVRPSLSGSAAYMLSLIHI